jgi:hypothetical protein
MVYTLEIKFNNLLFCKEWWSRGMGEEGFT